MISKRNIACIVLGAAAALAAGAASARVDNRPPGTTDHIPLPTPPWALIAPHGFLYVIGTGGTTPSGRPKQDVRMGWVESFSPALAHDVKVLQTNNSPSEDIVLGRLFASPANSRAVVESTVIPIGGLDIDYQAYNLLSGASDGFFNDESAHSVIDRAHCNSPVFNAYLAAEKASGTPDSLLAQYDFQIDNTNFNAPTQVAWVDEQTLYLRWKFYIYSKTKGAMPPTQDTFDLQINMAAKPAKLVACTAPASLGTPGPIHTLLPGGAGPAGTIKLDGTTLKLYTKPQTAANAAARTAQSAAGNIPK